MQVTILVYDCIILFPFEPQNAFLNCQVETEIPMQNPAAFIKQKLPAVTSKTDTQTYRAINSLVKNRFR